MGYCIDESDPGRIMSNSKQIPFWADTEDDIDDFKVISINSI